MIRETHHRRVVGYGLETPSSTDYDGFIDTTVVMDIPKPGDYIDKIIERLYN